MSRPIVLLCIAKTCSWLWRRQPVASHYPPVQIWNFILYFKVEFGTCQQRCWGWKLSQQNTIVSKNAKTGSRLKSWPIFRFRPSDHLQPCWTLFVLKISSNLCCHDYDALHRKIDFCIKQAYFGLSCTLDKEKNGVSFFESFLAPSADLFLVELLSKSRALGFLILAIFLGDAT